MGIELLGFTMSTWYHGSWTPHHHQASFLSWGRVGRKHILLVLSSRVDSISRVAPRRVECQDVDIIWGMKLMTNISPNHTGFKT